MKDIFDVYDNNNFDTSITNLVTYKNITQVKLHNDSLEVKLHEHKIKVG